MLLKIENLGSGLHPSELVVGINAKDGDEAVAVDRASVFEDKLSIGWPVGQEGNFYLVELPRQSFSGKWRVWVKKSCVLPDTEPQRRRA